MSVWKPKWKVFCCLDYTNFKLLLEVAEIKPRASQSSANSANHWTAVLVSKNGS